MWKDSGPIDMPEEEMMKVPLIDGWQNAKLDRNRYPVSRKDEGLIDE